WDLESGKEILTLRGHVGQVTSLALSADGNRLFSASADKTIKVWDLRADRQTAAVYDHANPVMCLAVSRDGKRLFLGTYDHTVKICDLETNKEINTLRGPSQLVRDSAVSPKPAVAF